jgi:hypothetical protein
MSLDWDNLRAAHLWSLAQRDLDLAERLAESSFHYASFGMRHEHAAMLYRTVQLGDECGRPSTTMLGLLSRWVDMQGDEAEERRLAYRGLDVAPSPHHPATSRCWYAFSSSAVGNVKESSEALTAFEHQAAAVDNTPDLDANWLSLCYLIDASQNACPAATPALRQQLSEIAARVRSPRLTMQAQMFEGHAFVDSSPPNFAAALAEYREAAGIARAAGDLQSLAIALRCVALAATGLGSPDALTRCHIALDAVFEIRHWPKTWQTLESATLALASVGRTEQAAVILGHLDAHSPGYGLERSCHFRDRARELIEADGGHAAAERRGVMMSADELVAYALAHSSADPPSD